MPENTESETNEAEDAVVLVCAAATTAPSVGSTTFMIADCGHSVIIAQSGLEAIAAGAKTRCIDCFGGYDAISKFIEMDHLNITPATRREVEGVLGPERTANFIDRYHVRVTEMDE